MTRIAVCGATGRSGAAVVEAGRARDDVEVVAGFASTADETDDLPLRPASEAGTVLEEYDVDAVVDFSTPEATMDVLAGCLDNGVALAVATTGFDEAQSERLREAAEEIPVLKATNFSRGIQALLRTVRAAVGALEDYDLELMESHHNGKVDAPSGTANTILETVQEQRDVEPVYGREGHAPRADDEIGVFARRAGDIRGEHELVLAGNDEVLSLSHRAEDRGVFAAGALDAAQWLVGRDPGWYDFGAVVDDA
ncbi:MULTISPECIES: 4-hydroxy-tetrahydrodipicolinate reductase [Halomicrobium]|uniref:4-hydroxy-tetrahydrodipicolinate reductase n=2 Tax=Halomicrobium mukohataei TaxID=57705 RepID=C7P2G0_HALMD|nr:MULTISPECIES: 4-hydroxy-tetrahydrodipicolinate reductase [Halomicrobium]ACV49275.1 dihydrodipicolinate reductase [Halomicrobium mukohataei DSM 12286]QCD64675.1 4-hydroxy-tetrahydrodipicolinate reductase [Halomicrobium mukohataei]QFR19482.1 4-hydroxy-tetrahydrodipicolinate reductase [Halomicrobium sp. ZPS1]